jgi:membrane protein implicated in regulation of membrane protease activity
MRIYMMFLWFALSLLFLLLELGNPGLFFFLSFFFGAVAAGLLTLAHVSLAAQALSFLGVSSIAFICLKMWIKKEDTHTPKTNVYALQGKRGIVMQEIPVAGVGAVKVGGEIWSAKAQHNELIKIGAFVEVAHVQGAHLIVTPTTLRSHKN